MIEKQLHRNIWGTNIHQAHCIEINVLSIGILTDKQLTLHRSRKFEQPRKINRIWIRQCCATKEIFRNINFCVWSKTRINDRVRWWAVYLSQLVLLLFVLNNLYKRVYVRKVYIYIYMSVFVYVKSERACAHSIYQQ